MHWRAEQEGAAHTQLSPRWARVAKPTVIEGRLFRAHSLKKTLYSQDLLLSFNCTKITSSNANQRRVFYK